MLLADNLEGQTARRCSTLLEPGSFVSDIAQSNTLVWNLPPECTDEVQPVDSGYGKQVKSWVAHYLEEWLQGEFTVPGVLDPGDSPIDCWHCDKLLELWKKRVLITHFVAMAVEQVNSQLNGSSGRAGSFVVRNFERTGHALTLDRHNDHVIRLEGCCARFGCRDATEIDYLAPDTKRFTAVPSEDTWATAIANGYIDISSDDEDLQEDLSVCCKRVKSNHVMIT